MPGPTIGFEMRNPSRDEKAGCYRRVDDICPYGRNEDLCSAGTGAQTEKFSELQINWKKLW